MCQLNSSGDLKSKRFYLYPSLWINFRPDYKSIYQDLKNEGINVAIDKIQGIAHNKIMIIDKKKVITGSFNFTKVADTKNAENVLLINDENIAMKYLENWQERKKVTINKN